MTKAHLDDGNSFSLAERSDSAKSKSRIPTDPSLTWEEQAYDRLKVLYGIGKMLSTFESVEKTFPEILRFCSTAFPFVTAVLIEKRGETTRSSMWHAKNVNKDQVDLAFKSSKEMFVYLTGCSVEIAQQLRDSQMSSGALANVQSRLKAKVTDPERFIALPLFVDHLPAFGILQLEASYPLSEKDLEFADALTDLVAVAVDRFYRIQFERDASEQKISESTTKLSESEASVEDLVSEKGLRESFVSSLTHDLKTPLSAAKISAQLVQRQPEISDLTQSLAARVVTNVSRADQMISDLLDANRIRSGESIPLTMEQVQLSELIRETIEELSTVHGSRFVLSASEQVEGFWDPKAIRRVTENLCTNAVKYGSANSPINITIEDNLNSVCIRVHNEGEPIKASEQKSLFQQFRRAVKAQNSRKKGWGIGLTLVRGVAEAHGGSVSVESDADKGTTFTVMLPKDSRDFEPHKGNK